MKKMFAPLAVVGALLASSATQAQEVDVGGVGGANAVVWPHYIAEAKGFFSAEGLKVNLFYSQSNAAVFQALTGGSTKIAMAAGLADPMYAMAAGADIALVRIDGQVGPYALEGAKTLKSIKDLKGKVVSVDEAKGTTMVYFVKMLRGNGMTRSDVDFIYAGATAARFAALESGAASAAMITAPQLFRAEADGFVNLGYDTKYAKDIPFTGEFVNRAWATANKPIVRKYLDAYTKAILWFDDDKNRAEAVDILLKASKMNADDIGKSFDLFHKLDYFDRSNKVSMTKVKNFYTAVHELDPSLNLDLNKFVMPIE
jgi:NitT/TauT family transport system substrate-binding protein